MKILIFIFLFISYSSFAAETTRERIAREAPLKKKTLSRCQLTKIVDIEKVMRDYLIPTLDLSGIKITSSNAPYFKLSKGLLSFSAMFSKGAAILLPITFITDILASPIYVGVHINSLVRINKINSKNKKIMSEALKKLKNQWDALKISRLEKLNVINNLRFYQLLKTNYDWLTHSKGFGEVYTPKEHFAFLYPFIKRHFEKFTVKSSKEVYFDHAGKRKLELFRYFHISSFSEFLYRDPKLCNISPLAAMEKLGKLFADDIKDKANRY